MVVSHACSFRSSDFEGLRPTVWENIRHKNGQKPSCSNISRKSPWSLESINWWPTLHYNLVVYSWQTAIKLYFFIILSKLVQHMFFTWFKMHNIILKVSSYNILIYTCKLARCLFDPLFGSERDHFANGRQCDIMCCVFYHSYVQQRVEILCNHYS